MSLQGKNIVIGVCGSIAAYKIASLIRLLVKENAQVQVIMTPDAQNFITPLTLATLSKKSGPFCLFRFTIGSMAQSCSAWLASRPTTRCSCFGQHLKQNGKRYL